jgi:hypothetical protein
MTVTRDGGVTQLDDLAVPIIGNKPVKAAEPTHVGD